MNESFFWVIFIPIYKTGRLISSSLFVFIYMLIKAKVDVKTVSE